MPSPGDEWVATNLPSVVWKFAMCWLFLVGSSSVPNMVEGSASPLTYTWLIESEALPYPHHPVMIERVGERERERETVFLSIILLTRIIRWFLPVTIICWRPNVLGCHIFSSQYLNCVLMLIWIVWNRTVDTTLLNTQHYKVRIESTVKWSNPGKGVAPSPTPWCSTYWKGSLQITLDNGHQLYFYLLMLNWIV